jgi:glycopeptide antibiotics resistance protein
MIKNLKKILALLPVMVLTILLLKGGYRDEYRHAPMKRLLLFTITIGILYCWFLIMAVRRKQDGFWDWLILSSFFVYIFMVLSLTGYFILFREISYSGWWQNMVRRIERRDHVNFQLFEIFRIYQLSDKQVIGNFIMLLPLGIYLPLLYKRLSAFIPVFFVCLFTSVFIELLQLVTSFRSVDVDDVLLNTSGACVGYLLYRLARLASPGRQLVT